MKSIKSTLRNYLSWYCGVESDNEIVEEIQMYGFWDFWGISVEKLVSLLNEEVEIVITDNYDMDGSHEVIIKGNGFEFVLSEMVEAFSNEEI
jgi:hypothetical protein